MRRAAAAADTRTFEAKRAAARDERRVIITAADNGMSELWALLPAEQAAAIKARLHSLADAAKGLVERTADQRRADALYALVTGASNLPGAGASAAVNVTVALSTLLGVDDQPAELDDHGTIPAGLARRIAFGPNTTWRRLLIDERGAIADVSAVTYRPPTAMARYVQLRDRSCQFPGCRRRAGRTELDHVDPWSNGGRTTARNLICLCSRPSPQARRRVAAASNRGRRNALDEPDGPLVHPTPAGTATDLTDGAPAVRRDQRSSGRISPHECPRDAVRRIPADRGRARAPRRVTHTGQFDATHLG